MERAVYVIVVVLLASPLIPLTLAWRGVLTKRFLGDRRDPVFLIVTTLSYLLMVSSLAFHGLVGPDYSSRRYLTIYANLLLMVAVAIWTTIRRGSLAALMPLISALVALVWAYALMVSSAV